MMISFSHGLHVYHLCGTLLAQLSEPGIDTPEEAALIFSGPQFFIALLSGLVLTFGFHLLLTNLSIAAGIKYVGHSSSNSDSKGNGKSPKIGLLFGVWTLVTVSLALFFACLLAVKLSLYNSPLLGAITGLVIWGTYFCLLFWVSSTTVGSLIGSVVKTATSSFQSLLGTATAALGARTASNQIVETAEAAAVAVRKELAAGLGGEDIGDRVRDYLMTLRSPALPSEGLEAEFERLIRESDITTLADRDTLSQLNRDTFEQLVKSRTDLSQEDAQRIADRLYQSWQKALSHAHGNDPVTELVSYLKSAKPQELLSDSLGDRLDQFLAEYRQQGQSQKAGLQSGLLSGGLSSVMGIIMGRTDLSDLDVGKISQRLKQVQRQLGSQVDALSGGDNGDRYSAIRADVETYLMNNYVWQFQPHRLKQEFWEVIYDPFADPGLMRQELMHLNRAYFAEILASRGLLTQAEIARVSDLLEEVRQEVLGEVSETYRIEAAKALQMKVYTFLQETPRDELMSDMGTNAFRALLQDPNADVDILRERFSPFGYQAFLDSLRARPDISEPDAQQIATRLDGVMRTVEADAQGVQEAAKARLNSQWQSLQQYLRSTGKEELNPEGIKADIKTLMHEPDMGIYQLRQRLAQFDRDTLVQLLSQRPDLTEADAQRILNQVESNWHSTIHAPAALTAQAKAQYQDATQAIENYLLRTGKPELNPDGIKRDLQLLTRDPKMGAKAIQQRLSEMDRDTLVKLLSQRGDLSEAEVNQTIDNLQNSIRDLVRMPQRLARRTQAKVVSFESALEDYLRNTNKEALNPEGIKRDLKLLLNDPRLGADRLQTRLTMIDRDTIVALLSQREDISREDAEAIVNRVLDVRNQLVAQLQMVQERIKSTLNSILVRIRDYLNSLGRPELDYYGIKRDLRQLMDDPQAGFESLRLRLSQVDRGTLVALLSSHNAISEADANRIIDQVEDARDSALRKAEQLEQAVEHRLAELKYQAQQRVEETRETAEAAAWWIFGTATVSAVTAAIAGSLAAGG